MLKSLHIENIAVIKRLDADFSKGFTVLTGETGAGKSILIDSIAFLLGGKAQRDLVRTGENRALVSGFFTDISPDAITLLATYGIAPDDGAIEIAKTITDDGKVTTRINGRAVSNGVGRACCMGLINIHGQHDSQIIQNPANHIGYLDRFAATQELLENYQKEYALYKDALLSLRRFSESEQNKERMRDLLTYQISDIESANLTVGEEEELLSRKTLLKNAKQLSKHIISAYRALYKNSKGTPAVQLVEYAQDAVVQLSAILPECAPLADRLADIAAELENTAKQIGAYLPSSSASPEQELEEIDERLNQIRKLKKKYGDSVAQVLDFLEKAKASLNEIESMDEKIQQYEKVVETQKKKLLLLAKELHDKRREAGKNLSESICAVLQYLDMNKVSFSVAVEEQLVNDGPALGQDGFDKVEFFISTNPGEPMKPLTKVASGGELSRTMLAIQCVLSNAESVSTLIFDEIDTGVSGKTSQKIGFKLHELSETAQVICITHAAQIAALADTHYLIRKEEKEGRVQTSLELLSTSGRIEELSRIIGGINITEKVRDTAKELLETSRKKA